MALAGTTQLWYVARTSMEWVCVLYLVALQRTFAAEAYRVRETLAATAAPHGGHVVLKERALVWRNHSTGT